MKPRPIFLSPHPDDAVWSCGPLLLAARDRGEDPLVITVFDGDPQDGGVAAQGWRRLAAPELRRLENTRALARLGIEGLSLGFVDAALRGTREAPACRAPEDLTDDLTGDLSDMDSPLVERLRDRLAPVLADALLVHAPVAGTGTHVDHRLLRAALGASSMAAPLVLYEDFPYPVPSPPTGFAARTEPADIGAWIAAAGLYRSQIAALFAGRDAFESALRAFAAARGHGTGERYGIRVWAESAAR